MMMELNIPEHTHTMISFQFGFNRISHPPTAAAATSP